MHPILQPFQLLALLLALSLNLSGCGFQLRQPVELPAQDLPLWVSGLETDSELYQALRRQLGEALRPIEDQPGGRTEKPSGGSRLNFSVHQRNRRVVAVDQRGKAAEYELTESVRFQLHPGGAEPEPGQQVSVSRSYRHNSAQVIGNQTEESELRAEMAQDLAVQILNRLRAALGAR